MSLYHTNDARYFSNTEKTQHRFSTANKKGVSNTQCYGILSFPRSGEPVVKSLRHTTGIYSINTEGEFFLLCMSLTLDYKTKIILKFIFIGAMFYPCLLSSMAYSGVQDYICLYLYRRRDQWTQVYGQNPKRKLCCNAIQISARSSIAANLPIIFFLVP